MNQNTPLFYLTVDPDQTVNLSNLEVKQKATLALKPESHDGRVMNVK
jgi:hypothetical protein